MKSVFVYLTIFSLFGLYFLFKCIMQSQEEEQQVEDEEEEEAKFL
jgi:hypothetical protein